jgi:hypothetical protein
MDKNNRYSTLSEATDNLNKKGYTHQFRISDEGLLVSENGAIFQPAEVELDEFHRFEGISNPSDMSIVYAVSTHSGFRGTVVDAYGANGSELVSAFMNRVKQRQYP